MKILLISSSVLPVPVPGYGGLEQIVFDLAIGLRDLGHKVSVLATSYSKLPPDIEFIDGGEPGKTNEYIMMDKVRKRIHQNDWDIIHCHSWTKLIYLEKKNNPKLKVISTLHGMNPYGSPPPTQYPNLVCLSKDHALRTSGALGISTRWVYNGVNPEFYRFNPKKGDRMLFLGRFMPGKGAHIAVDIANRLKIPLDLVGDDTMVLEKDYVKRIMKSAMDSNGLITYWGPVPRERAVEFFGNARMFLQCGCGSWHEPFGLVTIESLCCGTPVVSLNNGATPEIINTNNVDKCGFICNNVDEMIEVIKTGQVDKIKPEDCRKRGEQFDRKFMAKNYLTLYEEILNGKEW